MFQILRFFSQERFININYYKKFIVYKIPLYDDLVKNIIDVKIINNELIIRTKNE